MKAAIDTNVLMTGLISDSTVRKLLLSGKAAFYLPEFALEEIEKCKEDLKEKMDCSEEDFEKLKGLLLEGITLVPNVLTKKHMKEAIKIMGNVDKKDSVFIACALAINAGGILSFDKDFLRQRKVRRIVIRELAFR